jgi:aryl-alcohol dehydrogenase-like predicted oxidoreductase
MQYRQLGRTGLTVSEIGYGAWCIGAALARHRRERNFYLPA